MWSRWRRVGPQSNMTGVLMKRGDLDTGLRTGRMPCEHKGRDQDDVWKSRGMPEIACRPPRARRQAWDRFFFKLFEGTKPAHTSILDL